MTFTWDAVKIRVQTERGLYGADVELSYGLNILWADNNSGKSLLLNAMIYALGLDKMLSPKRQIPLLHAVRSNLQDASTGKLDVKDSYVAIQITSFARQKPETITIQRHIVGQPNNKLVHVWRCPIGETYSGRDYEDYYVWDPGSASNVLGFHRFLKEFLGWTMPKVSTTDGRTTSLFVEVLFPLVFVEQKRGWRDIPGPIPKFFRIRNVEKNAISFLLNLDEQQYVQRMEHLKQEMYGIERIWDEDVDVIYTLLGEIGGHAFRLPRSSSLKTFDRESAVCTLWQAENNTHVSLEQSIEKIIDQVNRLAAEERNTVSYMLPKLEDELSEQKSLVKFLKASWHELERRRQELEYEIASYRENIYDVQINLQRHQDVEKLEELGSTLGRVSSEGKCPTCSQTVDPSSVDLSDTGFMTVRENIEFLRSEKQLVEAALQANEEEMSEVERKQHDIEKRLSEVRKRIREINNDFVSYSDKAAESNVWLRIRAEESLQKYRRTRDSWYSYLARLEELREHYVRFENELKRYGDSTLSAGDEQKIEFLEKVVKDQARDYGFTSLEISELQVDRDTLGLVSRGFDIAFETSASDWIRLKWAYINGLLELSRHYQTNHVGNIVLDEPRQQHISKESFYTMMRRLASCLEYNQQAIVATSEDRGDLLPALQGEDYNIATFDGYVLRRIT